MATPGGVMDAIISDDRITHWRGILESMHAGRDQCGDAIVMFGKLMESLRPDPDAQHHLPLSPNEVERLRIALRTIADALDVEVTRNPAHFYVVAKGGR